MTKHVIFFHGGGGQQDYDADEKLAASLKLNLGATYLLHYPFLPEGDAPDLGRREQIDREISASEDGVILVGHSFGASMLLAYLSENKIKKKISGIFLISTPFWSGDEDWVAAFRLRPDFAEALPRKIPIFFYHCRDDEEVPFDHLAIYKKELPWATYREIPVGGHQHNNDLTIIANDIKSI